MLTKSEIFQEVNNWKLLKMSANSLLDIHHMHKSSYRPHFDVCRSRPPIVAFPRQINRQESSLYFNSKASFHPVVSISNTHIQLRDNVWLVSNHHVVMSTRAGMSQFDLQTKTKTDYLGGNCNQIMASDSLRSVTVAVGANDSVTIFDNLTCRATSTLFTRRLDQPQLQFGCCMLVDDCGGHRQEPKEVWVSGNKLAIWMYDLNGGRGKQELHTGLRINKMATSGNLISLACDAKEISVFDKRTNRLEYTLEGHEDFNMSVAMHERSPLLASGSQDMTVRLWDLRNPTQAVAVFPAEFAAVQKVLWADDADRLLFAEEMDLLHEVDCKRMLRSKMLAPGGLVGLAVQDSSDRLVWGVECIFQHHSKSGLIVFDKNQYL